MKIPYKKKRDLSILISAILWGVYAGNGIIKESTDTFDYLALICSIGYFLYFLFDKKIYYLTIRDGIIKQNWPFGKKLNLIEIKRIRHFAGEYILKTELNEMKINIGLIDEESLSDLKSELKKLNAEWI